MTLVDIANQVHGCCPLGGGQLAPRWDALCPRSLFGEWGGPHGTPGLQNPCTGLLQRRGTEGSLIRLTFQEFPRKSHLWKAAHFHASLTATRTGQDTELHFLHYSQDILISRLPGRYRLANTQKPQATSWPNLAGQQSLPPPDGACTSHS